MLKRHFHKENLLITSTLLDLHSSNHSTSNRTELKLLPFTPHYHCHIEGILVDFNYQTDGCFGIRVRLCPKEKCQSPVVPPTRLQDCSVLLDCNAKRLQSLEKHNKNVSLTAMSSVKHIKNKNDEHWFISSYIRKYLLKLTKHKIMYSIVERCKQFDQKK